MSDSMRKEMLRYWLWLSMVFGAANPRLMGYLRHFETPKELYEALQRSALPGLTASDCSQIKKHSLDMAESFLYHCRKNEIELVALDDERYPELLRSIHLPPILLTAQGNLSLMNGLNLTVVGTRRPSPYSEKVTYSIISSLAPNGFTIVSGFALGIDSVAHTAALDSGMPTIAVMGCGINVNYPRENAVLRNRMLEDGKGLLLSEYLPGTQPIPANFPKRNRILSGLSYGTAVIEAAARSGSLLTADCAVEQGRNLFCVPPHDLFDARYAGVIPLLRDGAIPLFQHQDILYEYYTAWPQRIKAEEMRVKPEQSMIFAESSKHAKASAARGMQNETASETEQLPSAADSLQQGPMPENEQERAILLWLREHGETHVNDLAAALDLDLSAVLNDLMNLELDGFVESLFGKQYRAVSE